MVPRAGVEPARPCGHRFLRPTRLPVPPPRRTTEGPRPYHWPVRTVLALLLLSILAACGPAISPSASVSPGVEAVAVNGSGPRISQPPVIPPTPPGTHLPRFPCADLSGVKPRGADPLCPPTGDAVA